MLSTILLLAAAACFAVKAFNLIQNVKVDLVALGLLFWVLASFV